MPHAVIAPLEAVLQRLHGSGGGVRPSDIRYSRGDASKATRNLQWEAETKFAELVKRLVGAERKGGG